MKKNVVTYQKIGKILNLKTDTVRKLENKGAFDIDSLESIIKFIISRIYREECKKKSDIE